MAELTQEQLRQFAADFRHGLVENVIAAPSTVSTLQFGSVRLGSHNKLWERKPHPLIIVSNWTDRIPPDLSLRPSTSIPHKGPGVLCLPAGAIMLKKRGRSMVPSYVLCKLKLKAPTRDVENMEYLNNLEEKYIEMLRKCLSES